MKRSSSSIPERLREEIGRLGKWGSVPPAIRKSPDTIDELVRALGFAKSAIKSGEPWTPYCERIIDGAIRKTTGKSEAQMRNDETRRATGEE